MTADQILAVIRDELARLAPEVDFDTADRNRPIQQEFDIDSMDFLNFITAVHHRLGIDIPEIDYPKLDTLDGAIGYLMAHRRPA